jgi:hypothetical protein
VKLGALKGKLPEELGPINEEVAKGDDPMIEMEDGEMPMESEEPVDLAGIPDDALLEEVRKRGLV